VNPVELREIKNIAEPGAIRHPKYQAAQALTPQQLEKLAQDFQ